MYNIAVHCSVILVFGFVTLVSSSDWSALVTAAHSHVLTGNSLELAQFVNSGHSKLIQFWSFQI